MEEIYTTHRKWYASGTVGENEAVGLMGAIQLQFAPRVVMAGVFPGQNTADSHGGDTFVCREKDPEDTLSEGG